MVQTAMTWDELRAGAEGALRAAGIASPEAEARWLAEEVSGYQGGQYRLGAREPATAVGAARLAAMLERRIAGEPLQYVLGSWSFRELDLLVDARVLIPRPETEITVEVALEEAVRLGARRGRPNPWSAPASALVVVDLGTGSGAIALSLASELPDAVVWATDVSADALAVARANLAGAGHPAARIRVAEGSWYDALPADLRGAVRVLVSNPPYVADHEIDGLAREVREHEPRGALVAGPEGSEALERVVTGASEWLERDGTLVCELAPDHAEAMIARALAVGFAQAFVRKDLSGQPRVLVARRRADATEPFDAA